jgi:hypothetical protein
MSALHEPDGKPVALRRSYIEEVVRQIGFQSALLAGFAFGGLTSVSNGPSFTPRLQFAFVVCTAGTVGLEMLALFVSGLLVFVSKLVSIEKGPLSALFVIAWMSYLSGMIGFEVAVSLLIWMKFRPAAPITTAISAFTVLMMAATLISLARIGDPDRS